MALLTHLRAQGNLSGPRISLEWCILPIRLHAHIHTLKHRRIGENLGQGALGVSSLTDFDAMMK